MRKSLLLGLGVMAVAVICLPALNCIGYRMMDSKIADAQLDADLAFGSIVGVVPGRIVESTYFRPKEALLLQTRIKEHGPFLSYEVKEKYAQVFGNHAQVVVELRCKDEAFVDTWQYVGHTFLLP